MSAHPMVQVGLTQRAIESRVAECDRPWVQPLPTFDDETAKALLFRRVPFNTARLAELADVVAPLRPGHIARRAGDVLRVLP